MKAGGLSEILKALLHNDNKDTSKDELGQLLRKIETDATEIYNAKYGLDDIIKFNIDCNNHSNISLIGRQSAKSLGCIRKSIKKNLHLMHENVRMTFESYLTQCGEGITPNDT
jgi:hypothetical protein